MEKQKLTVVVPENHNAETPIVIHVLEGKAPEPVKTLHPKTLKISGDINAPLDYARDRFGTEPVLQGASIPENNRIPIVTYMDKAVGPWIKLETNPFSELGEVITGNLHQNPDLKAFKFNESKVFDNQSFIEVLRKFAHCFKDKNEVKNLIKKLQNMVAKFETEVENLDDRQGNTTNSIKTALNSSKSGIPTELHFSMPLFSGGSNVEFVAEVEIEVDFVGGKSPKAMFGIFSLELGVELTESAVKITHEQVNELRKYFTCIRVEA